MLQALGAIGDQYR